MPQTDKLQSDSPTVEPTVEPIPPRYWWLKRIGVAAGFLFVALFALRLWWGWEAHRRLQAEIDRIIAAGEPIYPEDFDPKEDIPDDQNAARVLIQAEEAVNFTPEQTAFFEKVVQDSKLIHNHPDEVRKILEDNAEVFRRVHLSRRLPGVDWGMRLRTPVVNYLTPSFGGQRQIAKMLGVKATYEHQSGEDGEAVEALRDAFAQARALAAQGSLIGHLVEIACEALVSQAVEKTVPAMAIQTGVDVIGTSRPLAARTQVQELIAELLDDRTARRSLRRAMVSERICQYDLLRPLVGGSTSLAALYGGGPGSAPALWGGAWTYLSLPMWELDARAALRQMASYIDVAGEVDWGRAKAAFLPEQTGESALRNAAHPFSRVFLPSLDRAFVLHFRALAMRRMAAVALAIRLYELDHGGRPATLGDLVPEYLSSVPQDPFAGDGRAIAYLPAGPRPILYSIGSDGVDDGGRFAFRPRGGIDWEHADTPFFLDGMRPTQREDIDDAPTSLTQTGEDQKDADENHGQADEDGEGEEKP